jgi:hypothetical protein
MATWKRLTRDISNPVKIDVNMDVVATMEREENRNYTTLTFVFAPGDHLSVRETPDEIHTLSPLPSR